MMSSHKAKKDVLRGKIYQISRGEILTTLSELARAWRWDKSKVRRFLIMLSEDEMIEFISDKGSTTISICNYDQHQVIEDAPKQIVKALDERKAKFRLDVLEYRGQYPDMMLKNFFEYWTEHGPKDRKMRFEKETSFGLSRRLATWNRRSDNNNQGPNASDKIPVG